MASDLFTKDQQKAIVQAIKQAEQNTSGEIMVHIESQCKIDVMDRAANVFETLEMHKTELRNGVLFYLATKDHKFAILGDAGINAKVPDDFWNNIKEHMLLQFKDGKFTEGLCEGIQMAGDQLQSHFPYQADDKNELTDEISFGK